MGFTHLHLHTEYSLLDGSCKIGELMERAKELGMEHIAITDHGNMYGVIDFYRAAHAAGINPVIGCEVYVAPGSRFDREASKGDERYNHLVLLAENNQGYANLMKIVSIGFTEGFYYKPRVDAETLEKYHEGIIALSACLAGIVAMNLRQGFYDEAKKEALKLAGIFGPEHFYLELQDHGIPDQQTVNQGLLRMHQETGLPLVATNDVHYIRAEDAEAHDILLCIQTQKKQKDEDRMRYEGGQYYLKSEEEMLELFPYAKEAVENTSKIAGRCHVEIEFGKYKLPRFDVPEGYTTWTYLQHLCQKGMEENYKEITPELTERLDYELNTIKEMGFVEYFLIVWDFIRHAREEGTAVGPGRGSAAGSIVAYCLGITNIDPIPSDLLFERFLNPERVTMPDIDVDFCPEHRLDVIDYVKEKYGKDHVAQIVTFGTMAARGVIRDVGRVLDLPYAAVDVIAKSIPMVKDMTIRKALDTVPELKETYENDEQIHYLLDMAQKLEGLPRHTSVHASGVVITPLPVDELVPLSRGSDDNLTTEYTMTTLEELGLLKMDFLGLRTLTVVQDAAMMCGMTDEDMLHLDLEDKEVWNLIDSGRTDGMFQIESAGMKRFMKDMKPESMSELVAGISLYRPGPMDFIPKYIKGRENRDTITYDCPQLEPILSSTYGCIVYQEQVMQIVRSLAGYSYGRSDLVRRAMAKKKAKVMEAERKNFVFGNETEGVKGCLANGISEDIANKIFDEMVSFAEYAFNKSHAAAYGLVTYQTAWLKCHHPVEFMASLLTSEIGNNAKIAAYVMECRRMGIEILPPDVNKGYAGFAVADGKILYGLSAIKGVGISVIGGIVKEREENGKFRSMQDFMKRLSGKEVNKTLIENFIKAGAFDSLGGNRRQKLLAYPSMLEDISREKKDSISGQLSMFDMGDDELRQSSEIKYPEVEEFKKEELLRYEKEVLKLYLSGHPLEEYESLMQKYRTRTTADFVLQEPEEGEEKLDGGAAVCSVKDKESVVVGGMITAQKIQTTSRGDRMAFLTLEDMYGSVEVIVFPNVYGRSHTAIRDEAKVFIRGQADVREEQDGKVICRDIIPFSDIPCELWIQFQNKVEFQDKDEGIRGELADFAGTDPVVVYLQEERQMKKLSEDCRVDARRVLAGQKQLALLGGMRLAVKEQTVSFGKLAGSSPRQHQA